MRPLCSKADIIIPLAALVGAPLCDRDPLAATTTNKDAIVWMLGDARQGAAGLMPDHQQRLRRRRSRASSARKKRRCVRSRSTAATRSKPRDAVSTAPRCHQLAPGDGVRHVAADAPRSAGERLRLSRLNDRFIVLFEAHFKRNYIHVRDVARAFLHGIDQLRRDERRAVQRRASDANLSKRELCERIQQHLPKFVFLESQIGERPGPARLHRSNEKIERTGFKPAFSLDDGIRELIKGFAMIRNSEYANV